MTTPSSSAHALTDKRQTVWQLSAIQLSGWTSLPILATSVLILQQNSFYGAVMTIIVGNAILWFIRLGIIIMCYEKRMSTLDISQAYLGKIGGYFIGVVLLVSTLSWFIGQTTLAGHALTALIPYNLNPAIDKFTQISVLIGVLSTLLCMEGIVALKKLTTIVFPLVVVAFIMVIITSPFHLPAPGKEALSLSGLALVLTTNLGVTADLPTFFRHSKSLHTSIIALTVIQLISLALALFSLYFGSVIAGVFEINEQAVLSTGSEALRISLIVFTFLTVISANVANVYSASVGWEVIAPAALVGRKEYLILGLGLTTIFILIGDLFSIEPLLHISDSSLVNLCLVLITGYIISRIMKQPPTTFDQYTYFAAWFISTLLNGLQFHEIIPSGMPPLALSIIVILLILLFSHLKMFIKNKPSR